MEYPWSKINNKFSKESEALDGGSFEKSRAPSQASTPATLWWKHRIIHMNSIGVVRVIVKDKDRVELIKSRLLERGKGEVSE